MITSQLSFLGNFQYIWSFFLSEIFKLGIGLWIDWIYWIYWNNWIGRVGRIGWIGWIDWVDRIVTECHLIYSHMLWFVLILLIYFADRRRSSWPYIDQRRSYFLYVNLHVFTCFYMFLLVFTCFYLFLLVFTCTYLFWPIKGRMRLD